MHLDDFNKARTFTHDQTAFVLVEKCYFHVANLMQSKVGWHQGVNGTYPAKSEALLAAVDQIPCAMRQMLNHSHMFTPTLITICAN